MNRWIRKESKELCGQDLRNERGRKQLKKKYRTRRKKKQKEKGNLKCSKFEREEKRGAELWPRLAA